MNLIATDSFPSPVTAFAQACGKCQGSGRFIGYTGRDMGECFACTGTGKVKPRAYLDVVQAARATKVDDDALRATFDKLLASGLKRVKLRMQGFEVKPAKAGGKNAGALYVTRGETYLGKVINGRFDSTNACTSEVAGQVAKLVSDPLAAIRAYGQEVGACSMCGLELTDPVSIQRGFGPICAERLGIA